MPTLYCFQCGTSLPREARFCSSCGVDQSESKARTRAWIRGTNAFDHPRVASWALVGGLLLLAGTVLPLQTSESDAWALLPTQAGQLWAPDNVLAIIPIVAAIVALTTAAKPSGFGQPGVLTRNLTLATGSLALLFYGEVLAVFVAAPPPGLSIGLGAILGTLGGAFAVVAGARYAATRIGAAEASELPAITRPVPRPWIGLGFAGAGAVQVFLIQPLLPFADQWSWASLASSAAVFALGGIALTSVDWFLRQSLRYPSSIEARVHLSLAPLLVVAATPTTLAVYQSHLLDYGPQAGLPIAVYEALLAVSGIALLIAGSLWIVRLIAVGILRIRGLPVGLGTIGGEQPS